MALKDILLHADTSPSFHARLDLAVSLARTHGAHLTGIHVVTHPYYTPLQSSGDTETIARIAGLFNEKTGQAGVRAEWLPVDWPVVGVSQTEVLNHYACYSDLVIIGQPDHGSSDMSTPNDLPERLGLGTGRPLLVVPSAGNFATIGERVMVAWKPGREATRAVNDALPILEKARRVCIVTIDPSGNHAGNVAIDDAHMLRTHLERHGVAATHEHIQAVSSLAIGDMLLNHACEQVMDMLVMGAFAQSRRGVFMLSPVAKQMMNFMTVPLLLSH